MHQCQTLETCSSSPQTRRYFLTDNFFFETCIGGYYPQLEKAILDKIEELNPDVKYLSFFFLFTNFQGKNWQTRTLTHKQKSSLKKLFMNGKTKSKKERKERQEAITYLVLLVQNIVQTWMKKPGKSSARMKKTKEMKQWEVEYIF